VPSRSTIRAVAVAGLAAALGAVPVTAATPPTPPNAVRQVLAEPQFLLSLPAGDGAWTLWSGTLDGDVWWALSAPKAAQIAAAACPATSRVLTVCFENAVWGRNILVGRVAPRAATVAAFDDKGRRMRSVRRGGAYLAVARGRPEVVTIVARDREGKVVARKTRDYRRR
jgi:hypothetical protein